MNDFKTVMKDFIRENNPFSMLVVCKEVYGEFPNYTLWGKFLGILILILLPLVSLWVTFIVVLVLPLIMTFYIIGWVLYKAYKLISNKYNFRLKIYKDDN